MGGLAVRGVWEVCRRRQSCNNQAEGGVGGVCLHWEVVCMFGVAARREAGAHLRGVRFRRTYLFARRSVLHEVDRQHAAAHGGRRCVPTHPSIRSQTKKGETVDGRREAVAPIAHRGRCCWKK